MGLRDYFGKLFKPTAKPEVRELSAVSVSARWSTYPSMGLTPGRLAAIFQEADQGIVQRQMELFEEMEEKDAHLASLLQTRKLAVLSLDYEVLRHGRDHYLRRRLPDAGAGRLVHSAPQHQLPLPGNGIER